MQSRTQNVMKNIKIAMLMKIFTILIQFINRSIFIHLLSSEYLGLNGLFVNVLSFLSLAEMGIGSAVIYALYKPLQNKDIVSLKSLMFFYKRIYTVIGYVVLGVGIIFTPFLGAFINEMPDNMPYIHLYYVLYVVNSAVSYFCSYKRTIIVCDQKQYISEISTTMKTVVISLGQMLILIITHNYLFYLLVMVVCTIAENIIITKIADKLYPFLKEKDIKPLDKEILNSIKKNVAALFLHRIGSIVVNSTDNLIVSKFVSLSMVGLYSNYSLVIASVQGIIDRVFESVTASLGNLVASDDSQREEEVFEYILFANFWIFTFCTTAFICLFQPFIALWVGEQFQLSMISVVIISLSFYFTGIRKTVLLFRDAAGIFWYDRYKPLVEAGVNLVASIPLTIKYGIAGTKMGTIISTVFVCLSIEGYMLFKHHFNKSVHGYLLKQIQYFVVLCAVSSFTYWICSLLPMDGIILLILRGVFCVFIPNMIIVLIYHKTDRFNYYYKMFLSVFRKIVSRIK